MDADHPYELAVAGGPGVASMVEIPIQWALDDWEQYCFVLTNHPFRTGRPSRALALERVVEQAGEYGDVWKWRRWVRSPTTSGRSTWSPGSSPSRW